MIWLATFAAQRLVFDKEAFASTRPLSEYETFSLKTSTILNVSIRMTRTGEGTNVF